MTKVNPFDFRFVFIPMFLLVTGFGAFLNNNANLEAAHEYFVMVVVFVLSLVVGSWGIGSLCNRQLNSTPLNITTSSVFRSRTLFILAQFYYVYIFYKIVTIYALSGLSALETLRLDIKESINSYVHIPAQFVLIFCICHEIFYRKQRSFLAQNKVLYGAKRKDYAVPMTLIYFIESIGIGSRSIILVSAIIFGICWLRGTKKRVSIIRLLSIAFMLAMLFSFVAFYRLFSNPMTFNWWVVHGYFDSFDLQEIGLANAIFTMLWFTVGDMVYRSIAVVQHVINNSLDYMYGGASFFFLYSMLPGRQVNPAIMLNHKLFAGEDDVGTPATIVSQLFWDFGWTGVILGGLIIGLIGRGLIKMSLGNFGVFFSFLYAMFFAQLMLGIYGVFDIGILLFYTFLGFPLAVWVKGR